MPSAKPTVAVVGAGVAGLAAADLLRREGLAVTLLEARSRPGGRILTQHDFASLPIERGAEFVHGQHPEILRRIAEAGLHLEPRRFQALTLHDGKDITSTQSRERAFAELSNPDAQDVPIAETIARLVGSGAWSQTEARIVRRYVEGYMAADVDRVSARALSEEARAASRIHDDVNSSVREGYDKLVGHLARELQPPDVTVSFDTAIHRVAWHPGSVTLHATSTRDGSNVTPIRAERAIVTVPLSMLQLPESDADAIRFEPPPARIAAAAQALAMGNVVKLFFRFRIPLTAIPGVPEEIRSRLAAMTFLQTPDSPVPTWWKIGEETAPILVGWTGGPAADRLAGKTEDEIVAAGVETLSRALGTDKIAGSIDAVTVADWRSERWSRGAYSWIPAGALDAPAVLAAPVDDTLYFAGEATDTSGYRGTVHGALDTGLRAARQILASLARHRAGTDAH